MTYNAVVLTVPVDLSEINYSLTSLNPPPSFKASDWSFGGGNHVQTYLFYTRCLLQKLRGSHIGYFTKNWTSHLEAKRM